MNTAQWPQDHIGLVKPMEEMISNNPCSRPIGERKLRPQKEQALNCPRCNSTNTKFCYYNNYSLTQPRYFCKTCRRYWTEGGSLRNVPVGGGSRKNKRSSLTSSSSTSSSSKKLSDLTPPSLSSQSISTPQNPKINEGQDLNLGFHITNPYSSSTTIAEFVELPNIENNLSNNCSSTTSSSLSALELLGTGITSRGLNSFIPMPIPDSNTVYSSGFALQDLKPASLNFDIDGYVGMQGVQQESTGGRLLFPTEDLRQVSNTTRSEFEQNRGSQGGESTGYWTGILGGGGSSW